MRSTSPLASARSAMAWVRRARAAGRACSAASKSSARAASSWAASMPWRRARRASASSLAASSWGRISRRRASMLCMSASSCFRRACAGQFAEVEFGGFAQVAGAAAFPVVAVAGDPLGFPGQRRAASASSTRWMRLSRSASQRGTASAKRMTSAREPRVAGGAVSQFGHDEVAEALLLAQAPGGVAVLFPFQQDHVAVGPQHGLDGALPVGVGDFDDLGEGPVGDAGFGQTAAEAAHLGVGGRARGVRGWRAAGRSCLRRRRWLAFLALQVEQAGIGPGVVGFQVQRSVAVPRGPGGRAGRCVRRAAFRIAHCVVGGEVRASRLPGRGCGRPCVRFGVRPSRLPRRAARTLGVQFVLALLAFLRRGRCRPGPGRNVAAQFGHFQARHDLGFEGAWASSSCCFHSRKRSASSRLVSAWARRRSRSRPRASSSLLGVVLFFARGW
jgi:hypothetical protein